MRRIAIVLALPALVTLWSPAGVAQGPSPSPSFEALRTKAVEAYRTPLGGVATLSVDLLRGGYRKFSPRFRPYGDRLVADGAPHDNRQFEELFPRTKADIEIPPADFGPCERGDRFIVNAGNRSIVNAQICPS
jgi:hypothetical protein